MQSSSNQARPADDSAEYRWVSSGPWNLARSDDERLVASSIAGSGPRSVSAMDYRWPSELADLAAEASQWVREATADLFTIDDSWLVGYSENSRCVRRTRLDRDVLAGRGRWRRSA